MTKFWARADIPGTLVSYDVLIDGEQTSQSDLLLIGKKEYYVVEVELYSRVVMLYSVLI